MFKNKKLVLGVVIVLNVMLMTALTFYLAGIKKYGTPSEYRALQQELYDARQDSLRAIEGRLPAENVADSTFFGMSMYSDIIQRKQEKERELDAVQASIDSLRELLARLEKKERTIDTKTSQLETGISLLQDDSALKLAKMYDNMKTPMAIPIFMEMNDTLAVRILTKMQERTASRLLGALAETDVNKAARLNKLLSMEEVVQ